MRNRIEAKLHEAREKDADMVSTLAAIHGAHYADAVKSVANQMATTSQLVGMVGAPYNEALTPISAAVTTGLIAAMTALLACDTEEFARNCIMLSSKRLASIDDVCREALK